MTNTLDIDFVRKQFHAFQRPKTANFAFFENAGGTYVPKQLMEKLNDLMITKKVKHYGELVQQITSSEEMHKSRTKMEEMVKVAKDKMMNGT